MNPSRCWSLVLPVALAIARVAGVAGQEPRSAVVGLDSLLETRVSTAAKYSQAVSQVAGSVTIITSEDIERYGYRTLDEVLATVPGFYISNDRNYSYIGTRGFSRPTDYNNRILLLVDGNVVNENVFGAAPMGPELAIPLQSLERIEIVRGPGSALYGTGAIFGVINLITQQPASIDGARLDLGVGSYGQRGLDGQVGHRFANGVGVMLGGLWDHTQGQDLYFPEFNSPATNGGIARGLDAQHRLGVVGAVTWKGLRLHGRYGGRKKEIPTASYGMAFDAPGAYTWDAYSFIELNYDKDLNARMHLGSRVYYNHYRYDGDFPFADSLGAVTVTTEGSNNKVVGGEASLRWDLGSANRLTVGGEIRHGLVASFYSPRDTRADISLDSPPTVVSGYLQDEHQITRALSLLAGARYDASSTTEDVVTPRAGLVLQAARTTTLKLLYGEAFRAPSVYEAGMSTSGYRRNPNLGPERSRNLEAVWQQRVGAHALWSTSAYYYRIRGLIDLTVDSSGLYIYRNVGNARSMGFETGVDARFNASLSGFASYTYQRTVDQSDDARLTNSPAHLLKAGLGIAHQSWLRAGVVSRFESSRKTVVASTTARYFLTDLNLSLIHPLTAGRQYLELAFVLSNVSGARYATPGGVEHVQSTIRQDGRNFSMELRYGF